MRHLVWLVVLLLVSTPAPAAYSPFPAAAASTHILSIQGDNATSLKGSAGVVYGVVVSNATPQTVYLKLYSTPAPPICGSSVVAAVFPVFANTVIAPPLPAFGVNFAAGIGLCLVSGIADNDDTPVIDGVVVNIFWS